MMRARVLVGLIGAPIGICVLWMGGAPLALVAAIIAAIGGVEYARMCRTKAWTPSQPLISVGSALFVVCVVDIFFYQLTRPRSRGGECERGSVH